MTSSPHLTLNSSMHPEIWPAYIGFLSLLVGVTAFCTGNLMRDAILLWHQNFWTNVPKVFTFTSNLDHIPEQVVVFSWFNSISFQLFVIFYFVLLVFARSQTAGLIVLSVLLCSNILLQGWLMVKQKIVPFYDIYKADIVSFNDLEKDYFNVYNHLDIYLLGFLTGWIYLNKKVSFLRVGCTCDYFPFFKTRNPKTTCLIEFSFQRGTLFYPLLFITLALSLSPVYTPLLFEMGIMPKKQILLVAYFSTKRLLLSCFPTFCFLSFKANRMSKLSAYSN